MKAIPTSLPGVLILEPTVFGDSRGFFLESFNQRVFDAAVGPGTTFVQDNHSRSARGVLRGLHYQTAPHGQGKLVRVARGTVWDVVVDIRRGSDTFGQWAGVELSGENHRQLWVPAGYAHGFVVLSDEADLMYKVTGYRVAEAERVLRWDDPTLAIDWPVADRSALLLSDKDRVGATLDEVDPA